MLILIYSFFFLGSILIIYFLIRKSVFLTIKTFLIQHPLKALPIILSLLVLISLSTIYIDGKYPLAMDILFPIWVIFTLVLIILIIFTITFPIINGFIFLSDRIFGVYLTLKILLLMVIVAPPLALLLVLNTYEHENYCVFEVDISTWPRAFNINTGAWPLLECKYYPLWQDSFGPRPQPDKPLILLYPERAMDISVKLEYAPGFSATFPRYDIPSQGWQVYAYPDGTLEDKNTHQDTYGLFWEGNPSDIDYDLTKGWVIRGSDIREFLYEKLTDIGLNTKEKSDFIMFWYPKLQDYPYLQITFAGNEYVRSAKLDISPKPDSLLRVFMVAKPLDTMKDIQPQKLEKFERIGFSAVEWGGTILQ